MFSAETQARIDRIRSIPISSIYPGVKDSGTSDCPVCGSRNKFYVKSGWARCFRPGCELTISSDGKSLDIIGLFRFKNGLYGKGSFFKAIKALEEENCISTNNNVVENKTLEEAAQIYNCELSSRYGHHAREYLKRRGIDSNLIDVLSIGYSRHDSILSQYGLENLDSYGLYSKGKEVFNNRIVFPVKDLSGCVRHFTARYIGDIPKDEKGEDMFPRWKHSLSTSKGSITDLMGLEENIPSYKDDYVVITEGFMDCLSLYQLGIQSLCIFGLYGITKHINKLRKFKNIYAAFDIDRFSDDHPHFPKEYKSWRVVLPQLVDLQILMPDTNINLWFIPGEGSNLSGSYTCKDINEWVLCSSPTKDEVLALLKASPSLVDYMVNTKGPDLQHHESLIRLLISTGRDYSCLEKFIPDSFSHLDYAAAILTR